MTLIPVTANPSVSEGVAVSGDCFVAIAPRNDIKGMVTASDDRREERGSL